jgi:hypothetical protein
VQLIAEKPESPSENHCLEKKVCVAIRHFISGFDLWGRSQFLVLDFVNFVFSLLLLDAADLSLWVWNIPLVSACQLDTPEVSQF